MHDTRYNSITIRRLTALWALCESGLGGWMHALKIPFTGIFVGGFAVIIISLLAHYSRNSFSVITRSLALVLLIKFTVSPQSPAPAYLAVAFQGLLGAVLYRTISNYSMASVIFAIVAMLESALQKLIVMTLIFGKSLWIALDGLYSSVARDFNLPQTSSFSWWVIIIYAGIYAIWGLALGIWMAGLPERIQVRSGKIIEQFTQLKPQIADIPQSTPNKRKRGRKIILYLLILLSIVGVYYITGIYTEEKTAAYIIMRTVFVLLLLFGLVNPLIKMILSRWAEKNKNKEHGELQAVLSIFPNLQGYVRPAYLLANEEYKGWKKYPAFITNLIVLTLQPATDEHK